MPIKLPCRFCTAPSCYHCGECGANLNKVEHHLLCSYYPRPRCIGCNDTGVASSGKYCYPCSVNGRLKER